MPWTVKENYQTCKGFAVVDKTGKIVTCHGMDKAKAETHMKALYANAKDLEERAEKIMLEGIGPALIAVAATNKPHLPQRGGEMSVLDDGRVRIPVARKGIYKHSLGPIVFNDQTFQRMIENFNKKVTDFAVHLDLRHKDAEGALALLDAQDGGELKVENDWLVIYGKLTDDSAANLIKSGRYRYASAEFHPNYESNLVQRLSTDELDEIDLNIKFNMEDNPVTTKTITIAGVPITLQSEDGKTWTIAEDQVVTLEATAAKVALPVPPEPEIPQAIKLEIEALKEANRKLERERELEKYAFALKAAENFRDEKGNGHSQVFIDLARKALLLEGYDDGAGVTVKLEAENDPANVARYFRSMIKIMLEKVPGQVPMVGKTQPTEFRLETTGLHYTQEELDKATSELWN